ncbi:MAG: hypothetical protein Q7T22_06470 [Serpentinimonas sp.]|nr:hypothetical protein [Serpentinimonas sp.]
MAEHLRRLRFGRKIRVFHDEIPALGALDLMHIKRTQGGALYISPFALHAHPMAQRTTHLWNLVGHGDRII